VYVGEKLFNALENLIGMSYKKGQKNLKRILVCNIFIFLVVIVKGKLEEHEDISDLVLLH
jgi:hypothetical protein